MARFQKGCSCCTHVTTRAVLTQATSFWALKPKILLMLLKNEGCRMEKIIVTRSSRTKMLNIFGNFASRVEAKQRLRVYIILSNPSYPEL